MPDLSGLLSANNLFIAVNAAANVSLLFILRWMQSQLIEMKHFRGFKKFRCSVAGVLLGLAALSQAQNVVPGYPLVLPSSPSADITNPVAAHAWPSGSGITVIAAKYGNSVYALKIFSDDGFVNTAENTYAPATGYASIEPKAVKIGSDNKAYVACKLTDNSGHTYIQVLRFSSGLTGPTAYSPYNATNTYDQCEPVDLTVDSSGNVFVTGIVQGSTTGTDTIVVGFNTSGAPRQPQAVYAGSSSSPTDSDIPVGIGLDNSGNVVVGVSTYSGSSRISTVLSYVASTGVANTLRSWIPASSFSPFTSTASSFAFYNNHLWMAGGQDYSSSPGPGAYAADFDCSSSGNLVGTGIISYTGHTNSSSDALEAICSSAYGTYAVGKFLTGGSSYEYKLINAGTLSVIGALGKPKDKYCLDSLGSYLFAVRILPETIHQRIFEVRKFGADAWSDPFPVDTTDFGSSLTISGILTCGNGNCYVYGTTVSSGNRKLLVYKLKD